MKWYEYLSKNEVCYFINPEDLDILFYLSYFSCNKILLEQEDEKYMNIIKDIRFDGVKKFQYIHDEVYYKKHTGMKNLFILAESRCEETVYCFSDYVEENGLLFLVVPLGESFKVSNFEIVKEELIESSQKCIRVYKKIKK